MLKMQLFGLLALIPLATTVIAADKKKANTVTVGRILDVDLTIEKSNPPNLVVSATGQVPTLGYKNARLTRAVYKKPPADGIQDYTLTAEKPTGIVGQALSNVSAKDTWQEYTKQAPWLNGVRIHGRGNGVKVIMLNGGKE